MFRGICSKKKKDPQLVDQLENETKEQTGSVEWNEARYGRITASKLHEAAHCKTRDGALVEQIMDTRAMERGRRLEEEVRLKVEVESGNKIVLSGLILIPHKPIFGASPDGLTKDYVVEIKCPISQRTKENYIKNGKITKKFEGQIQLQMLAAKKLMGLFCVADPDFEKNGVVDKLEISFNEKLVLGLMSEAKKFWESCIMPRLIKSCQL